MVKANEVDIFSLKCPKCAGTVSIDIVDIDVKHIECDDCDHILKEDEYR